MLYKFKNLIFSPVITIKKIFYKIQSLYFIFFYNEARYEKEQSELFSKFNLSRIKGLEILDKERKQNKIFNNHMSSEHKILLASISDSKKNVQKILEIGTHDAENAYFLSKIFPDAKITTVDLDDDDDYFKNSYNRESFEKRKEFCKNRDKILESSINIDFKKMNSINLCYMFDKYDLIWVDGAHGYPHVTIDIANSLRLLKDDGLLLCDDVWTTKPLVQDSMYNSLASFETLVAFQNCKMIEFDKIYKRIDKFNNANKNFRKFIAVVKKLS